jgi:hypothetical protein
VIVDAALLFAALEPAQPKWTAPSECPDATHVEVRARRLARDPTAALEGHGVVTREPAGYRLTLEIAGRVEQHLASTCEVLAELAALSIAVAADPIAVARVVPEVLTTAPDSAPARPGTPESESRDQPVRPRPRARRSPWAVVLATHGLAGIAQLPRLDAGLDLALSIERPRFAVQARGGWLSRERTAIPGFARARADLSAADASLRACGLWQRAAITLSGCGGVELGAVVAKSLNVTKTDTSAGLWVAAFGAVGLRGWVHPRVALELGADLLVALYRPSFVLHDNTRAEVTPGVGGIRGWAGIAVRLAPPP